MDRVEGKKGEFELPLTQGSKGTSRPDWAARDAPLRFPTQPVSSLRQDDMFATEVRHRRALWATVFSGGLSHCAP